MGDFCGNRDSLGQVVGFHVVALSYLKEGIENPV